MSFEPGKGHAALRRGRVSQPLADYFLTLCTADRQPGIHSAALAGPIWREIGAMQHDSTWRMRCGVVMPDHLHLLITLGERLSLSRSVQRLKAKTSASIGAVDLGWEDGYYDHRMRADDSLLAVFRYIYFNPYRAGLIRPDQTWPQYKCCAEDWAWFGTQLDRDSPTPVWLT